MRGAVEGQQLWEYCNETTCVEKYFCVDSRNNGLAQKRILLLQPCKPPQHKRVPCDQMPSLRVKVSWTFLKSTQAFVHPYGFSC